MIPNVIDGETTWSTARLHGLQVDALLELARRSHWRDGKDSAHGPTKLIKQCSSAEVRWGANSVAGGALEALVRDEAIRQRCLPRCWTPFRFVRYEPGDHYGRHTDIVAMPQGFRADFSVTILLQAADAGGILRVEDQEAVAFRDAVLFNEVGGVFVYPSTTVHQVTPVESGTRIAIISWIQSMVREDWQRRVLAELEVSAVEPDAERRQAARSELLRHWV